MLRSFSIDVLSAFATASEFHVNAQLCLANNGENNCPTNMPRGEALPGAIAQKRGLESRCKAASSEDQVWGSSVPSGETCFFTTTSVPGVNAIESQERPANASGPRKFNVYMSATELLQYLDLHNGRKSWEDKKEDIRTLYQMYQDRREFFESAANPSPIGRSVFVGEKRATGEASKRMLNRRLVQLENFTANDYPLVGLPLSFKGEYDVGYAEWDGKSLGSGGQMERYDKEWDGKCFDKTDNPFPPRYDLSLQCDASQSVQPFFRYALSGGILLGTTNVPYGCVGLNSFNNEHGYTVNAFDPSMVAGGSSGGPAAAVALGLTTMDTGSDSYGSIRAPAAWNGVFGHMISPTHLFNYPTMKPRPFWLTGEGALTAEEAQFVEERLESRPLSDGHDYSKGPVARIVDDLELGVDALTGSKKWRLNSTLKKNITDFKILVLLGEGSLKISAEQEENVKEMVTALKSSHAQIVVKSFPEWAKPMNTNDVGFWTLQSEGEAPYSKRGWQWLKKRNELTAADVRDRINIVKGFDALFAEYDVVVMPAIRVVSMPAMQHGAEIDDAALAKNADEDGKGSAGGRWASAKFPMNRDPMYGSEKTQMREIGAEYFHLSILAYLPSTTVRIGTSMPHKSRGCKDPKAVGIVDGIPRVPVGVQILAPRGEDMRSIKFAGLLQDVMRNCETCSSVDSKPEEHWIEDKQCR